MRKTFRTSKAAAVAQKMPRLKHKPGEKFDWSNSEVAAWIVEQPEILSYLISKMTGAGLIVYDPSDNTWRGAETP